MLVVQYAANQCLPILEPYHIPLEDFGRDNPDTDSSDLYSGERPGDPALRLAILQAQAAYAPAFLAVGTMQCEIRWNW